MLDLCVQKRQGEFLIDAAFVSHKAGVTALFGSSGAGKTSIINMVAGLVRPDKGHIVVKEQRIFDSEAGFDVPPEKRRMGYIFQDGRLFPHMSVRLNIGCMLPARITPAARQILGLKPGMQVFALIKSVAVSTGSLFSSEGDR